MEGLDLNRPAPKQLGSKGVAYPHSRGFLPSHDNHSPSGVKSMWGLKTVEQRQCNEGLLSSVASSIVALLRSGRGARAQSGVSFSPHR